jgi:hypothetical protein
VLSTLIAYLAVYAVLLVAYVAALYRLARKAGQPPAAQGGGAPIGLAPAPAGPETRA